MKLATDFTINDKLYKKGDKIPGYFIYPFFLCHMGVFGTATFAVAYFKAEASTQDVLLLGGFTLFIYLMFYLIIFGRDEVKWMLINGALGFFGIFTEINWLLGLFGKSSSDYPFATHIMPFLYYILYTFLLRQALLHLANVFEHPGRKVVVERFYIAGSMLVYGSFFLISRLF